MAFVAKRLALIGIIALISLSIGCEGKTQTTLEITVTTAEGPAQWGQAIFREHAEKVVDYAALGFGEALFEPADWLPATSPYNRLDGVLDPYAERDPVIRADYVFTIDEDTEEYAAYFPPDVYRIYTADAFSEWNHPYAMYMAVETGYVLRLFEHDLSTLIVSFSAGYFVEVIESNGYYSYVLNSSYYGSHTSVRTYWFEAFHCIYHEDGFPYAVYFNDDQIFLINKDDGFAKDCIYYFDAAPEIALFKY